MMLFLTAIGLVSEMVRRKVGLAGAFLTALLLVTFPPTAAVTSWVSSQTDLLVGLFMVLSVYPIAIQPELVSRRRMLISLGFAVLAYLSKESAAILGPVGVVYALFVLYLSGFRGVRNYRWAFATGVAHLVLMGLYLVFRLWRLGQVGVGEFDPDQGKVWHAAQLYVTAIRDILLPITQLYQIVPSSELAPFSSIWPLLLTACVILAVLSQGRIVLSFLLSAFILALIPLLTAAVPHYYPESGMADVRRYLYVPSFFLCAAIGISCGRNSARNSAIIVFAGLFALLQGLLAQTRIAEYAKAGQFTRKMQDEIRAVVGAEARPIFYVTRIPDTAGNAYVFRSGFPDMMKMMYPDSQTIDARLVPMAHLPSGNIYTIAGTLPDKVQIAKLESVQKQQQQQSNAPRYIIDFERDASAINNVNFNEHVTVTDRTDVPIITVAGKDPIIFFKHSPLAPHSSYKQVYITLEFLDASESSNDLMQYMWLTDASDAEVFYIDKSVTLVKGRQTIRFDVAQNPQWYEKGLMVWNRIDLPETYRGRIALYAIGMQ